MADLPRTRRMTAAERRDQLIGVARMCFASAGFDGTSVEEIASRAEVSKPVVYEHFGGKEGLYAVIVDREVSILLSSIRVALSDPHAGSRRLLEQGTLALLTYIETYPEGFQIIMRDSAERGGSGFASILSDVIVRVEGLLIPQFEARGYSAKPVPLIAQGLAGLIAMTGQWWLDNPEYTKEEVTAILINLAWNGLHRLDSDLPAS